ncbi:ExbD/TolR family protein [Magnetococcales bacterium HHB-1]
MRFRTTTRAPLQLDITPLIDVVFLLVLFFMLTTTFSSTGQLNLDLPAAKTEETATESDRIILAIDHQGQFYLQNKRVTLTALEQHFNQIKSAGKSPFLVIQADKAARHEQVVQALDRARQAGLHRLAISTAPEKEPVNRGYHFE